RIGWLSMVWPGSVDAADVRIALGPVGEARGRINDRDGRPIAGAEVTPAIISRKDADRPGQDYIRIPPELAGPLKPTRAADGSFAVNGPPQGAELQAIIAAPGFGEPRIYWDTTKPVAIVLDGRLGRIEGTLKAPDARGLSGQLTLSLRRQPPTED